MAQLKSTNILGNLDVTGDIVASSIKIPSGSNESVLLAGGGTKPLSELNSGSGVSSITFAGTALTKNGDAFSIAQASARSALGLGSAAYRDDTYFVAAPSSGLPVGSIAVFANTNGKSIKSTGINIDASNNLSTPGNIALTTGEISWTNSNVIHSIRVGQESGPGQMAFSFTTEGIENAITIGNGGYLTAANKITASFFESTIAKSTTTSSTNPPFKVKSTDKVDNLNADLLDNLHATSFARAPYMAALSDIVLCGPDKGSPDHELIYRPSTYIDTKARITA